MVDYNFFQDLCDIGVLLDGNTFHMECLLFCLNEVIIHQDLNLFKIHGNIHHIRCSTHDTVSRKPDELFFLSKCHGGVDQYSPLVKHR